MLGRTLRRGLGVARSGVCSGRSHPRAQLRDGGRRGASRDARRARARDRRFFRHAGPRASQNQRCESRWSNRAVAHRDETPPDPRGGFCGAAGRRVLEFRRTQLRRRPASRGAVARSAPHKPVSRVVLCLRDRWVPGVVVVFPARGEAGKAFRRLAATGRVARGTGAIRPSARAPCIRAGFTVKRSGGWRPWCPPRTRRGGTPSPAAGGAAGRWERRVEGWPLVSWFGDHYLLERSGDEAARGVVPTRTSEFHTMPLARCDRVAPRSGSLPACDRGRAARDRPDRIGACGRRRERCASE